MDVHKRAAYDEELLNNSDGVYYIKIGKFRINIILFSFSAFIFFLSKYAWDYYRDNLRVKYFCPLGEEKFEVDKLKFTNKNVELLKFIETTKEEIMSEKTKKIAEDDEYEYYVEEEKN